MEIKITNLKNSFNNMSFLNIDNIIIKSNAITGILGDNGAGKSTFLKIIGGLQKYDIGDVLYDGEKLNETIQKKITLIFQKPYMLKRNVFKNLEYPLKIRKILKEERIKKIYEMAKKLEIENLLNKDAINLSGGEMQKVALGRGLILEPKLLLLDEPTSGIDKKSIATIENAIFDYKKNGGTVVIITHSNIEKKICDFTINMDGGKIAY